MRPDTPRSALASLALMPLIVPQGLYVKLRAAQMPEAAGPRSGVSGQGKDLRVLILGDSSAAGVGVTTQGQALAGQFVAGLSTHYRVTWHLQAQSGATTASAIGFLDEVPHGPWDVVLTALGVNDVKNGNRLGRYVTHTSTLYRRLVDDFDAALICASGMPPVRDFPLLPNPLRWAMQHRADLFEAAHKTIIAQNPACRFLAGPPRLAAQDMSADGFHPGPAIYAQWARLAVDLVTQALPDRLAARRAEER